ncbi:hypothetical protein [Pseudomonas amygdali]|nr:hypothetical protein [Pseudomonas amygdali]AXH59804.1 hypothetical protein PLA107_031770 [Pseudomonas amygdali pv. lachrymans str. M301315]
MKRLIQKIAILFFATPLKPKGEIIRDLAAFMLAVGSFALTYIVGYLLISPDSGDEAAFRATLNGIGFLSVFSTMIGYSAARQFFQNLLAMIFLQTLSFNAESLLAMKPEVTAHLDHALQWVTDERGFIGLTALCGLCVAVLLILATPPIDRLCRYLFACFDFCRSIHRPWEHVVPFSKLDHRSIAIHEAGHAIIMAFDPLIDDNCRVVISQDPSKGRFGYCRHAMWPHNVHLHNYHVMRMVGNLAGVEAERVVLGSPGMGGAGDYKAWLELAQGLLQADPDEVYFSKPKTAPEIEHNRLTLNALRKRHQALARRILEVNQEVLEQMTERLMECYVLKGDELRGFLSQVKPVEGMPDLSVYHTQLAVESE